MEPSFAKGVTGVLVGNVGGVEVARKLRWRKGLGRVEFSECSA